LILCKQQSTSTVNHETVSQTKSNHATHNRTKSGDGTDEPIKLDHYVKLRTDGFIKTIINNARDLYNELRNDFRLNRGFNIMLVIVVSTYVLTFIGRFMLEYGKAKREEQEIYSKEKREEKEIYSKEKREEKEIYLKEKEIYLKEKQMDFDHEYKMMEFGLKQNSTRQSGNEAQSNEQESSLTDKK